jgi:hypothetical protein
MAFWLPMLGGMAAQGIGAIVRGAMHEGDQWTQEDYNRAQGRVGKALAGSTGEPYATEAEAASKRLTDINNPWMSHAIGDADYMRDLQEGYIADLLEQAQGVRSVSREEAARQEEMQRGMLGSMAASTRDRFASAGAQTTAGQERAALHQNMVLPTEQAAAAEQNAAQDMLTRVYAGMTQQDLEAMERARTRRELLDRQNLFGALQAFGHHRLGAQEARSGTMGEVGLARAEATEKRKS